MFHKNPYKTSKIERKNVEKSEEHVHLILPNAMFLRDSERGYTERKKRGTEREDKEDK